MWARVCPGVLVSVGSEREILKGLRRERCAAAIRAVAAETCRVAPAQLARRAPRAARCIRAAINVMLCSILDPVVASGGLTNACDALSFALIGRSTRDPSGAQCASRPATVTPRSLITLADAIRARWRSTVAKLAGPGVAVRSGAAASTNCTALATGQASAVNSRFIPVRDTVGARGPLADVDGLVAHA